MERYLAYYLVKCAVWDTDPALYRLNYIKLMQLCGFFSWVRQIYAHSSRIHAACTRADSINLILFIINFFLKTDSAHNGRFRFLESTHTLEQ